MLTHGIPPDFRGGVYLLITPYTIGSVQCLINAKRKTYTEVPSTTTLCHHTPEKSLSVGQHRRLERGGARGALNAHSNVENPTCATYDAQLNESRHDRNYGRDFASYHLGQLVCLASRVLPPWRQRRPPYLLAGGSLCISLFSYFSTQE